MEIETRYRELIDAGRMVERIVPGYGTRLQVEKQVAGDIEADGDETVLVTASTADVDRYSDVVEQDWVLDFYNLNPVVLADHAYRVASIVGQSIEIGVQSRPKPYDDEALMAEIKLDPATPGSVTETVRQKLAAGSLRAVSVGFRPLEWTYDEEINGFRFLKNELLEISFVAVPANPLAVVAEAGITAGQRDADAESALRDIVNTMRLSELGARLRR